MVCVCQRVSPTAASAAKATRVSTVIDGRSLWPAGGSAVDMGSVECQRVASPSATVSQGTPDLPVTQVKWSLLEKVKGIKRQFGYDMTNFSTYNVSFLH